MRASRGFTLIELAIVLAIIGLITGGGFATYRVISDSNSATDTRAALSDFQHSIAAFVAASGRLPTVADAANMAPRDGWGNLIEYRVGTGLDTGTPFTCPAQGALATAWDAPAGTTLDLRPSAAPGSSAPVAFVIASTGGDGVSQFEGAGFYTSDGPASGSGDFDDHVMGRSFPDLLRDIGCRVQVARANPVGDDEDDSSDASPSDNPQLSFPATDRFGTLYSHSQQNTGGMRSVSPAVTAEGNESALSFTTDSTHNQQDYRSCVWSRPDVRLRDAVVRTYFEVSFDANPLGRWGMVKAFLPFEVTHGDAWWQNAVCGEEGEGMGFSTATAGMGTRGLMQNSHFVDPTIGNNQDLYDHVRPFGLELDTWWDGADNRFREPTAQANHSAIVEDNVYHCDDPRSGNQCAPNGNANQPNFWPNPSCTVPSVACAFPTSGGDAWQTWLLSGQANRHKVRIELEMEGGSCAANQVWMRAWVWPHDVACEECGNINVAFTGTAPYQVSRCLPASSRTVSMGHGWTLNAMDKVRPGFTAGISGRSEWRANPVIRSYQLSSFPKYVARPDAAASAQSSELYAPTVLAGLNWDRIVEAGGVQDHGWTAASWLRFPDLGAEVMSWQGQIVVRDWYWHGWGVRGIGGSGDALGTQLGNLSDEDEQASEAEERLTFHFDNRYNVLSLHLTQFNRVADHPERLRVTLSRGHDAGSARTVDVESCRAANSSAKDTNTSMRVNIAITGDSFDTVTMAPRRRADGEPSGAFIRSLRACGSDFSGTGCTLTTSGTPAVSCTASYTAN